MTKEISRRKCGKILASATIAAICQYSHSQDIPLLHEWTQAERVVFDNISLLEGRSLRIYSNGVFLENEAVAMSMYFKNATGSPLTVPLFPHREAGGFVFEEKNSRVATEMGVEYAPTNPSTPYIVPGVPTMTLAPGTGITTVFYPRSVFPYYSYQPPTRIGEYRVSYAYWDHRVWYFSIINGTPIDKLKILYIDALPGSETDGPRAIAAFSTLFNNKWWLCFAPPVYHLRFGAELEQEPPLTSYFQDYVRMGGFLAARPTSIDVQISLADASIVEVICQYEAWQTSIYKFRMETGAVIYG